MHSIFRYVCLVVLTTLLNSSYIRAQTLYKCEVKGATSYQDRPCSEGKSTTMSSNLDDLEVLLVRGDVEGAVKYAQDHGISKEVLLELNDVLRSRELERERQRERQRVADLEAEDERQKLEQEREEAAATNARFAESQETRRVELADDTRRMRASEQGNRDAMRGQLMGQCQGHCASEQGRCQGSCQGNGICLGNCSAWHGRCIGACSQF